MDERRVTNQVDTALVRVKDLKKHYPIRGGFLQTVVGQVRAVDGISFEILEGETLGLVGESGCGKTTTGRMVVKAIEPTDGQILVKMHDAVADVRALKKQELREFRRNIQIIYQDPYSSLNPRMTILDIIGEPLIAMKLAPKKEVTQRVRSLLPRVGLKVQYMSRYPHAFSGGQRQRIGIARALASSPRLIVADEPVSSLDVSVQAQILNLMLDLQNEFKLTYLFISHDLGVIRHISDRIMVMYVGKIVEISDAETLFVKPLHPYTEALLSAIPKADPKAKRQEDSLLAGDVADPANIPSGCCFHPRCRYAKETCKNEVPLLLSIEEGTAEKASGHRVACHRAKDLTLRGEI